MTDVYGWVDKADIKICLMELDKYRKTVHIEYRHFNNGSYFVYDTVSKHRKLKLGRSIYQHREIRKNFKYNINEAPKLLLDIFRVSVPSAEITRWARLVLSTSPELPSRKEFCRALLNLLTYKEETCLTTQSI